MIPNITIGARTISAYMICTLIGMLVAGTFTVKKAGKSDELEFLKMLLWSSVGIIIGGPLLYGITNIGGIVESIKSGDGFFKILSYFSGNVFYGGLLGAIAAAVIYCRIVHVDIKRYTDLAAMFIPLFHMFGRIGCFLSGCCYGVESKIGFVYHYSPVEMANHVRRFPIQLVEAAGNFVIFFVIYRLWKQGILKSKLLSLYLTLYPVMRFTLEFFRGDSYRGFLFRLSTSQIISIILFIYGIISLTVKTNFSRQSGVSRERNNEDTEPPT